MGHIAYSKDKLIPLIDRLNKYPIGLVDNDILREILSLLFSEEEAYVGSKFPLMEATLPELCRSTGMSPEALLPILESMADKGLIMDMPYGDTTYYLLMPGVIGFIEFSFMKHRADLPVERLAKLMTEYFHQDPKQGMASEFFGSETQLTRSLVYEEHIPVTSVVTSYESARQIIERSDFGAAGLCYCRHKRQHEGRECQKGAPMEEICISLGNGARFLSRRGFAVPKTKAELLAIIDRAHELRLTHVTDNIRNRPTFICNCCGCCCEIMAGVQMGYYDGVAKTSFIAVINPERCDYCGQCFLACNVKAIGRDREASRKVSQINRQICLGCGA
ncbi:MAG: 4Fe-4S dicluster domain-containing protein, partial [candidate division KSB1 bacterium]|nr:4Fe-4S dicluster domain-containing protein [candidate division KSB1 bacterium]